MLNSAQHARSAASRLDDVIDRSALEQAKEGLGGRDIEEPFIGLEVQKSTLEWCETAVFSTAQLNDSAARPQGDLPWSSIDFSAFAQR